MLPFREEGEEKNIIGIKKKMKKEPSSTFIKQMVLSPATRKRVLLVWRFRCNYSCPLELL